MGHYTPRRYDDRGANLKPATVLHRLDLEHARCKPREQCPVRVRTGSRRDEAGNEQDTAITERSRVI